MGGNSRSESLMEAFRSTLDFCGLRDLGFSGPKFTWSNRRVRAQSVIERLDRCVCNTEWQQRFPCASINHLDFWKSDHRPIVLDIVDSVVSCKGVRRFHYELCWSEKAECSELIKNMWKHGDVGDCVGSMVNKLATCSQLLNKWNIDNRRCMQRDIMVKKRELACLSEGGVLVDWGRARIKIGAIIKDSEGKVLACCSQAIVANYTVKTANLMAILTGLQFAIDCGLPPDVTKINDADVVNWISNANKAALGLAKHSLNIVEDAFWLEEFPICINSVIESDKADMPEKGNGRFPCTWFVGVLLLDLSLTLVEEEGGDHGERVMMVEPAIDATVAREFDRLKEEVRSMLTSNTDKDFQKLCLIDDIQRLGVAYHFEREIEDALESLYNDYNGDDNSLYTVALRFRLLRQQGYYVPLDVFNKFKDGQAGKFKESLIDDVAGMLCLYEAAHLGIRGEYVLDEALAFTTSHLESVVAHDQVSPRLAEQITHALNRPIRRSLPRLEAKYNINFYSGDDDSKNQTLLIKFAKLDFNMLQVQHQKELSNITEWWKSMDVKTNFSYARDRVVECYFWIMGVYFEPQYSFARIILTKVIAMASILDDTYDAYGTYKELELFTEAIQRWDINTIDDLPEYMKVIYRSLLDVYKEAEEVISKEGRSDCIHYPIQEVKKLVKAYCMEAKWCNEGYVPTTTEEYWDISLVTTCYPMLAITSFLGMGNIANKEVFQWSSNDYPNIIKASTIICRLMDDIVSHQFEQKRQHVVSGFECYMKQHRVSEGEVIKLFREKVFNAWKDVNQEFLKPTAVPIQILTRILNLSRVMDVIYKDDDGYTNSHVIKHYIDSLLLDPFLL
ncbi:hypothetical protein LWI29_002648 [Acer saccharum]|uniref:Uncharacterized protein n=1 Tax=Acer saccharum TaxID=4024 RepID=A0AA39SJ96_ACESA|nr:hypothetical protein LWI29_002648 [Acer saccharum]